MVWHVMLCYVMYWYVCMYACMYGFMYPCLGVSCMHFIDSRFSVDGWLAGWLGWAGGWVGGWVGGIEK